MSSLTDAWVWTVASSTRKEPTNLSSPVIPPDGKEPTRVPGGKEGRDLITSIHSFGLAQAELALPAWGHGGCKRHRGLLCCAREGSNCAQNLPVTQGMQDMDCSCACWNSSQCVPGTMAMCQQESLGIICGGGNGQAVPPSIVATSCSNLRDPYPDL